MKKRIGCFLCAAMMISMAVSLTGCGSKDTAGRSYNKTSGVEDVLKAGMSENAAESESAAAASGEPASESAAMASEPASEGAAAANETTPSGEVISENAAVPVYEEETERDTRSLPAGTDGIDVDLTTLSSTMVYSEVFAMMMDPEKYVGKNVRMTGLYSFFHDAMTDKDYSACVVQDATACCAQGIEFVLTDDYHYPEDYPEIDEEITVTGVFELYQEGEYTFFHLNNASLS